MIIKKTLTVKLKQITDHEKQKHRAYSTVKIWWVLGIPVLSMEIDLTMKSTKVLTEPYEP